MRRIPRLSGPRGVGDSGAVDGLFLKVERVMPMMRGVVWLLGVLGRDGGGRDADDALGSVAFGGSCERWRGRRCAGFCGCWGLF